MLKNKIEKNNPKKDLHSEEELQFELELELSDLTLDLNQTIELLTQQESQEMRSDLNKTACDTEKQPPISPPNFYPNLVIPPDFFDSPMVSPRDRKDFKHEISQAEYLHFPTFIRKVLYPELRNLIVCEMELDKSAFSPRRSMEIESCLIDLNYKTLLKLYEISEKVESYAELMKKTEPSCFSNIFFKECKMFMKKYDAIFSYDFFIKSKEIENIRVKCYRLLKADKVIEQFIVALKETLITMGEDSELECDSIEADELGLFIKENNILSLYAYPEYLKTEEAVSEYGVSKVSEISEEARPVSQHKMHKIEQL